MRLEIDDEHLSETMRASLKNTIELAKEAHYTDAAIRINGRDVRRQADWIKHIRIVEEG